MPHRGTQRWQAPGLELLAPEPAWVTQTAADQQAVRLMVRRPRAPPPRDAQALPRVHEPPARPAVAARRSPAQARPHAVAAPLMQVQAAAARRTPARHRERKAVRAAHPSSSRAAATAALHAGPRSPAGSRPAGGAAPARRRNPLVAPWLPQIDSSAKRLGQIRGWQRCNYH